MRDVCDGLEADIEKLKDENDRTSKKYKKRREKLKKLLILKGISEWNSSDDDSDWDIFKHLFIESVKSNAKNN